MSAKSLVRRLATAAIILPLALNMARGATINYSTAAYPGTDPAEAVQWLDFQQRLVADPRIKIRNVTETSSGVPALNPDVPLLYPLVPVAQSSANGISVFFNPTSFVQVDTSSPSADPFEIKSKRSELTMVFEAQRNTGNLDPSIAGYSLNQIDFQMTGSLSVVAPFFDLGSAAYGEFSTVFQLTLSRVNHLPLQTPITVPYALPIQVTRQGTGQVTNVTSTFNVTAVATNAGADSRSYLWDTQLVSLSEAELRSMFGITNENDALTEISLSLVSNVLAAGYFGQGSSGVNSVTASGGVEAVPVPEPPAIILASLGAVAVVANGYRRRKQRRSAEVVGEDGGLVALTA